MRKYCLNSLMCLCMLFTVCVGVVNAKAYNINSSAPVISPSLKPIIAKYRTGDYLSCANDLLYVIKKDPYNAYANYYLALCYAQLGYEDLASKYYNMVISINSNLSLTYYSKKALACTGRQDSSECLAYSDGVYKISSPVVQQKTDEDKKSASDVELEKFIKSNQKIHPAAYDAIIKNQMERKLEQEEQIRKQGALQNLSNAQPTEDEIKAAYDVLKRAGLGNKNIEYSLALNSLTSKTADSDLYSTLFANSENLNNDSIKMMLLNQVMENQNSLINYGI